MNPDSLPCTPGKAGDATGCKNCIAGQYQNLTTQTSCLDCDKGKASSKGSATCQTCAAGKFVSTKGSPDCFDCPQGWKRAELDLPATCKQCEMGEKASSNGSAVCQICAAGKFVSTNGSSSCFECPQGWMRAEQDSPTSCKQCDIGLYNNATGQPFCLECDAGMFADQKKSSLCSSCRLGMFTKRKAQIRCLNCDKGFYSSETAQSNCKKCPPQSNTEKEGSISDSACVCAEDYYAERDENGNTICSSCPPNSGTNQFIGATNSSFCRCQNGYWKPANGKECLICPKHATCMNGRLPLTNQGYWKAPWKKEILDLTSQNSSKPRLPCLESTACVGAKNQTDGFTREKCAEFYQAGSPLCAACARGSYKEAASFKCLPCSKEYSNSVLIMSMVVIATLVVIIGFTFATVADGGEASAVDVVILKLAINSGIISAGASAFPLAWPPAVVTMFKMYAVASASAIGDSLSADCVVRKSDMHPVQAWGLTMAVIPPGVILLWIVLFTFLRCLKRNKKYLNVHLPVSIIVTLTFAHPVITKAAVKLLACRTVAGRDFLDADFNIECDSEKYRTWAFTVAVPLLVLFTFGMPLGYALAMYRHVRDKNLQEQKAVYGFFFSGFRKEIWWFELWNTLRKSLFTISTILSAPAGVMMQTWFALILLLCFLAVFLVSKPYEQEFLNNLERSALTISIVTLMCGLGLFTNKEAGEDAESKKLAVCLTVVIVLFNIQFVLNVVLTFFKHTTYCTICQKCQKEQVVESVPTRTNSDAYTIAALRMQVLLQEALKNKARKQTTQIVPLKYNGLGRSRSRGVIGRAGTIKGSLRYQAKVAVVMKRAKDNLDAHDVSSVARKKKREVERTQARSRLADRLQFRSRKNLSRNNMVVPMMVLPSSNEAVIKMDS